MLHKTVAILNLFYLFILCSKCGTITNFKNTHPRTIYMHYMRILSVVHTDKLEKVFLRTNIDAFSFMQNCAIHVHPYS